MIKTTGFDVRSIYSKICHLFLFHPWNCIYRLLYVLAEKNREPNGFFVSIRACVKTYKKTKSVENLTRKQNEIIISVFTKEILWNNHKFVVIVLY